MEDSTPVPETRPIEYVFSSDVPGFIQEGGFSLLATTYQAQFVMALNVAGPNRMTMTLRKFERPTGLAVHGNEMAVCARRQVWLFRSTGALRDLEGRLQPYDRCFAPRAAYITGDVMSHEVAFVAGDMLFVNTRFSCICTFHRDWSFVPQWKPPFVSAIVPEDRCHLNGMATDASGLRYVTALGRTDEKEGWRSNKASGGIVMRWPQGDVVAQGLAMPHSPRLYRGQLFVLDSGRGELKRVDVQSGACDVLARLPGYLRGLCFFGDYAFVGLCKMRETREFGNVPIEAHFDQLKCAIYIIDLRTGQSPGFIEFTRGVEELFDIQVVPGVRSLGLIGMEDETIDGVFVVPDSSKLLA